MQSDGRQQEPPSYPRRLRMVLHGGDSATTRGTTTAASDPRSRSGLGARRGGGRLVSVRVAAGLEPGATEPSLRPEPLSPHWVVSHSSAIAQLRHDNRVRGDTSDRDPDPIPEPSWVPEQNKVSVKPRMAQARFVLRRRSWSSATPEATPGTPARGGASHACWSSAHAIEAPAETTMTTRSTRRHKSSKRRSVSSNASRSSSSS